MSADPLQLVRDRLAAKECKPKGSSARCPAHEDRNASLSIGKGRDDRALVKCHAGCSLDAILASLELTEADLFAGNGIPEVTVIDMPRRIVAQYPYHDEHGALLYEAVRYEPKDFRQRRPNGVGGWKWTTADCRKVPYRLPELIQAVAQGRRVFVVEGEKDVDRLARLGLVATCNVGGAGKWRDEYAQHLAGAHVTVLPDSDDAGTEHARDVAASLLGTAATVQIVALPGLPEKGDVSDWLDAGHTRAELEQLVTSAADLDAVPDPPPPPPEFTYLSEIPRESVEWVWPGRIPAGKLTILEGDPERAKSTITLDFAARVSTGAPMPDGHEPGDPAGVLLVCAEDDVADTLIPRLLAHNADLTRVATLTLRRDTDGRLVPLSIPEDLPRLEKAIRDVKARLVVVDPITAYLSEEINTHNDASVRRALTPLADVAQRLRVGIVLVRHLNKDSSQKKALYRGGGSIAFSGAVRSVMVVDRHPEQQDLIVLARVKNNLAVHVPSLGYKIASSLTYECPRIDWQGPVQIDADALVRGPDARLEAPARDAATEVLLELLTDGPMEAKKIRSLATEAGVSKNTLERAKDQLGVRSRRLRDEAGKTIGWEWRLPSHEVAEGDETAPEPPEPLQTDLGVLGGCGEKSSTESDTQVPPEPHGLGRGVLASSTGPQDANDAAGTPDPRYATPADLAAYHGGI